MRTFEFSLVASGLDPAAEDFESRFYDAGCDDAAISFQKGHIIADFAREAGSLAEAIASAIGAVRAAGAAVDRVEPDPLVSLAEIAGRAGLSRAALTQYAKGRRGEGDFPAPVARVTSGSPLWDWASVARWLFRSGRLTREDALAAGVVARANLALARGETAHAAHLEAHAREAEARLGGVGRSPA